MTTSVAQAMATGLPVIATIHSAFPDQVTNAMNGYLVPEADYRALSERITYLIEHAEEWPAMSRHARKHVQATYDAKALIDRQIELYESLVV